MRPTSARLAVLIIWLSASALPALGATCEDPGGFSAWLDAFRQDAAGQGISQRAISSALSGVAFDPGILAKDHAQGVFRQSFEQFSGRMISAFRMQRGSTLLKRYAATFDRIEGQFGVPGPVLVAIWGLETDFGADSGKLPTLRSLATLAYDCRRAPMFHAELLDALRIIDRGDMTAAEMRGAWAGEIGQTQFMPSSYIKFAVDFDGDGRRDLIRSAPDALASTANYLKGYGWRRGEPWGDGAENFQVLLQWNKSMVYSRTVAAFADRLARTNSAGQ
jgi:lytic murein transglycosylase